MRMLIASDIHGSWDATETLLARIEEFVPDRVLLLGDLLYHGPRNDLPAGYAPKKVFAALNELSQKIPITAVRGNCDAEVDQMVLEFPIMKDYEIVIADGYKFGMTHGHLYSQGDIPDVLGAVDVLFCGHTHIKIIDNLGYMLVNPGSISIPKDICASYATYDDGEVVLHAMDGAVLESCRL